MIWHAIDLVTNFWHVSSLKKTAKSTKSQKTKDLRELDYNEQLTSGNPGKQFTVENLMIIKGETTYEYP